MIKNNLCLDCIHFNRNEGFCKKKQEKIEIIINNCSLFHQIEEPKDISKQQEFVKFTLPPIPQVPEIELEKSQTETSRIDPGLAPLFVNNVKYLLLIYIIFNTINLMRPLHFALENNWISINIAIGEFLLHFLLVPFSIIMILFGKFAIKELDELFLENGKNSRIIQNLFSEKRYYIEFSNYLYQKMFSKYMIILSFLLASFILTPWLIPWITSPNKISMGGKIYIWPFLGLFYSFIYYALIGAILALIILIFLVLISELNALKHIMRKREHLAITVFLKNLRIFLFEKNKRKIIKNKNSASYFGFQESNRYIGEYLFRITGFLLFLVLIISVLCVVLYHFFSYAPEMQMNFIILLVFDFTFAILTVILFIYPQLEVHNFLKSYKREIIELFNLKIEEINSYFLLSFHESIDINKINPKWNSTEDLINEVEMLMMYVEQMESMGTWSYDFPEILKLIAVALSPFAAIITTFISI